ncbi:MAG: AAA family ATPase, partial [Gammaproteobacteria bacterium]
MKILNIRFKNINSLEGENRINFEQAPFADTGVFAITGPNGSGK